MNIGGLASMTVFQKIQCRQYFGRGPGLPRPPEELGKEVCRTELREEVENVRGRRDMGDGR